LGLLEEKEAVTEGEGNMSAQLQFAAKVKELITQSKNLSLHARKQVLELLDEARKKIIGDLRGINQESFSAAQLNVLKQSIDRAMTQFGAQATSTIDTLETAGYNLGAKTVAQPLVSAGLESSMLGQVDTAKLKIVQGYTADLITGLAKDASAKINSTIQRSFLGGQKIDDIIKQIGQALDDGKGFTGLFSPIGRRATSIAMNEIGRVNSIASQARLEDAAEHHPDLQKQWHHLAIAMVPRPGHLAADGQVVDVDQPFIVEGEALMFPRDPAGSPENTIGCHCVQGPYFSEDALKPSDDQKSLLDQLGISVKAA
jgi:uncharacterized protein with gpF-like domain